MSAASAIPRYATRQRLAVAGWVVAGATLVAYAAHQADPADELCAAVQQTWDTYVTDPATATTFGEALADAEAAAIVVEQNPDCFDPALRLTVEANYRQLKRLADSGVPASAPTAFGAAPETPATPPGVTAHPPNGVFSR